MDELTTHELRGTAFAANLRRAFGAPVKDQLPPDFSQLLDRLSAVRPGSERDPARDRYRLGS